MIVSTYPQPKAPDFYTTYINKFEKLNSYFTYPWHDAAWASRVGETLYPEHRRKDLVDTIRRGMRGTELHEAQLTNLQLLEKNALVTVAGQQTGILTGPLYSIHKAVTAIILAKQIHEKTGQPMVPVFWMAGEDHDILEVNHFFIEKNREVTKLSLSIEALSTEMVADQTIDASELKGLLHQAFVAMPETEHTSELWKFLMELAEKYGSYKEFFLQAFQHFFQHHGLLFVNSSDPAMREMGKPFTIQLIEENAALREAVYEKEQQLSSEGYGFPIQCRMENAHLFYVKDNHRYLLEATDEGFANEDLKKSWTKEELIQEVDRNPSCISHNVVTRPLMQQFLLPVHTFIGGPGEIAYWALLKEAFEAVQLKMPIVSPRFSITLLPVAIEQKMDDVQVTIEEVWNGELPSRLHAFIDNQKNKELTGQLDKMVTWLEEEYRNLQDILKSEEFKIDPLLEKNKSIHVKQLSYLNQAIEDLYYKRFDAETAKFLAIQNELVPNESLQERVYSPLHYLNKYGLHFVDQLVSIPYQLDGKHYVIHLA
ncbi:bacillithiol biosynthesis cysteine-adding enzyme BshC [Chryseomicrobium palamuruense]|uniref:Putative cysteine ligase BshC n=1 Tax=Chryseomicrobium palamuruense TaxID=682973 RepID=A0ABV8UUY3_9BACL